MNSKTTNIGAFFFLLAANLAFLAGCRKYLELPPPNNQITTGAAFLTDNTTSSVVTGIFASFANSPVFGSALNSQLFAHEASLYTDELENISADPTQIAYYQNNLTPSIAPHWPLLYKYIYDCNISIEGIRNTSAVLAHRNQWLGEALFCRAFVYFHLTNLYGEVPLAITADYRITNKLARAPRHTIYEQIIRDLKESESLLSNSFKDGFATTTTSRGRPNSYAATALLSRVYLYTEDWENAEVEATRVISNTGDFQLSTISTVFLANSKETIWAIVPSPTFGYVSDYSLYAGAQTSPVASIDRLGSNSILSQSLLNLFEPGDLRLKTWLKPIVVTQNLKTCYLPSKYRSAVAGVEYQVVLRLSEQYLIRAEARAHLNKIPESLADLTVIRKRANLPEWESNSSKDLLARISKERQIELFTEFGHRFFDLRRTKTINSVMETQAKNKGGTWSSYKEYWPIPPAEITINPNLSQTPGY